MSDEPLKLRILQSQVNRANADQESHDDWDEAVKPATATTDGTVRQLGDNNVQKEQFLPNTNPGRGSVAATDVPGGIVADWVPRFQKNTPDRRRRKQENLFPTIAVLVTVERDWEYELWLLTENLSKWEADPQERSWDISYVKSMPREFTGTPWYAWGYPGFTDEGVFSGAEYGFFDTIPTRAQLGVPALLHTKTLDVNQQLGISTPLFWDEDNPAPLTKTKVNFSLTDAWLSGFFTDNYLEITHLYKDRYDALSFANGREKFPDDWWIYPYFQKDVDIEPFIYPMPVARYKYVYSSTGEPVDFDNLTPDQYTIVLIPLYFIDPQTGFPVFDDEGNPVIAIPEATALDGNVEEQDWTRVFPETCELPISNCIAQTQLVDSETRNFGTKFNWDILCFKQGELIVYDDTQGFDDIKDNVFVNLMPVSIAWETVPYVLSITGIPDTIKNAPSTPEGGSPTTITFEAPFTYSTSTTPEFRWKWASQSQYKEINASSYILGKEITVDSNGWRLQGTRWMPGSCNIGAYNQFFTFNPPSSSISGGFWGNNCRLGAMWYFEVVPGLPPINGFTGAGLELNNWVALNPYTLTYFPPVYRPYIEFNNGQRDYGQPSDLLPGYVYLITIESDSDTIVTVNGDDYVYAEPPTFNISTKEKLTVIQNELQIFEGYYSERYPVRLEGIQFIAEYKRFIHNASISFKRGYKAETPEGSEIVWETWSWYRRGKGNITIDIEQGDCNENGRFFYVLETLTGKLGKTTITEQDSEREPDILWKFIEYRENGDEVLSDEVLPELSLTYVHAGGKIYSGVHCKDVLIKWNLKGVCDPSPNHQYVTIRNYFYNDDLEFIRPLDARVIRPIVSPRENQQRPWWGLVDFPPLVTTTNYSASVPGDPPDISVGETIQYIGTFDSEPESAGGSAWQATLMASYLINENGNIDYEDVLEPQDGIQWSNHHEYFVGRERTYWGPFNSKRDDVGVWLNGWEPINTVGLTGQLPSGEFRSLSLYHETTPAKLTYGIKGVIDTVQGVNKEPLHFVFVYGAHYAVFGKVNNGLDDDEKVVMLKSTASDDLTALLDNQNQQNQQNPPYPANYSYDLLMRQFGYSWGGFKNYIAPYTPGLFNEVHSINKQLPELYFSWPTQINTSGIESVYKVGFRYVDTSETYSITVGGQTVTRTGLNRTALISSLKNGIELSMPEGTIVTSDADSISITSKSPVSASPGGGISGLEILTSTNDELTIPGQPQSTITYRIYFPGINAPYTLEIDGVPVVIGVDNSMSREGALSALQASLGAYQTTINGDFVEVSGVFLVEPTTQKDYNDILIKQGVFATESTDKSWRGDEIRWDSTPTCGIPETTTLALCNSANVSERLKYQGLDYATYPYAKVDIALNPTLFSVHNPGLLDLAQPNRLLDQDFTGEQALIVEYSKTGNPESWKEIELQVKKIKPSWFGATREQCNIIAIAPSVINYPGAATLRDLVVGEPNV